MVKKIIIAPRILLICGLFLVSVGGAGLFFISTPFVQDSIKGLYRYHEKITPRFENLQINNGFIESGTLFSDTVIQNIQDKSQPLIVLGKTYINTESTILENPLIPDRIEIPSIDLVAPIVIADFNVTKVQEEAFGQWIAPSYYAAGWHPDSALLGKAGNSVINGHHNAFGNVFGNLVDVKMGDLIVIKSGDQEFRFVVANRMILAERFQTAEVRLENARWLAQTDDIRLTLVTCYPKESNTHRLILVARPVETK